MQLDGAWLTRPETQAVFAALGPGRAWFVGGCVRDALAARPVGDIDIATPLLPEEVIARGRAAGLHTVPTGLSHGTVTVVSGGRPHEVTTFRRDVATDGRRATVRFSDDLAEDAARRDLTMNALYARPDGAVLDPLGTGVDDLMAGRVRFIGDPATRIREDYLRILRYFRFRATHAAPLSGPDPEALAAIADLTEGIDLLSAERIGAEMRRLLAAPDPAPELASMQISGVLPRVLPGADPRGIGVLVALEAEWEAAPDALRRLVALGGDHDRLALGRAETRALSDLRHAIAETPDPAEAGYRLGIDRGRDAVLIRAALLAERPPPGARAAVAAGAGARFPVRAADLMPALTGPDLGRRLGELEARWIASGFALTREALLNG